MYLIKKIYIYCENVLNNVFTLTFDKLNAFLYAYMHLYTRIQNKSDNF